MRKNWKLMVMMSMTLLLISGVQVEVLPLGQFVRELPIINSFYAFILALVIFAAALGPGMMVQGFLKEKRESNLEVIIFSGAIGLGIVAYQILLLGFLGLLNRWFFLLVLAIDFLLFPEATGQAAGLMVRLGKKAITSWRKASLTDRIFGVFLLLLILSTLTQALTPPGSPDALSYHLLGPLKFLENRKIIILPEIWGANGPFTIEMLYMISLGLGSDITPRLIHFGYGLILCLLTFQFGKRFIGKKSGWYGAIILAAAPIFPIWASIAYADLAWAVYEFAAVYAYFAWKEKGSGSWLVLSGMMMGLGMGSKYLALGGTAVLGFLVILESGKNKFLDRGKNVLVFGSTAFLVGIPWYAKNFVLGGNPVYPLIFGGVNWPSDRVGWLMDYLNSFGAGSGFFDYLLLPWNLYARHSEFSTFLGSIEILSFLFPLILLLPFVEKSKMVKRLAFWLLLRACFWAAGSLQVRFLLPLMPGLALLTALVLTGIDHLIGQKSTMKIFREGLIGGVLLTTLIYSLIFVNQIKPFSYLLGREDRDSFLSRTVFNYQALNYAQNILEAGSKVMMLWDSEGYYCDQRCLPDADHSRWTREVRDHQGVEETISWLRSEDVTHLMLSAPYANFVISRDNTGYHQEALDYLLGDVVVCLDEVYQDQHSFLWEVNCP